MAVYKFVIFSASVDSLCKFTFQTSDICFALQRLLLNIKTDNIGNSYQNIYLTARVNYFS